MSDARCGALALYPVGQTSNYADCNFAEHGHAEHIFANGKMLAVIVYRSLSLVQGCDEVDKHSIVKHSAVRKEQAVKILQISKSKRNHFISL